MSQTKEFILKTAFSLFIQKNFKAVTLKEIVDKTGLSKGAFYHYYTSKEKLFFEVVNTFFFKAILIDYNRLRKSSLKEFYTDYANHVQKNIKELKEDFFLGDPEVNINFVNILFDAINLFPGFREKLLKTFDDEIIAWTKMITIARRNNEFKSPMTDEQIARMFIYSSDGISLRLLFEGRLDFTHSEMLTLWDNFYEEIKN
jgi:AcrR family transcriptional regulator